MFLARPCSFKTCSSKNNRYILTLQPCLDVSTSLHNVSFKWVRSLNYHSAIYSQTFLFLDWFLLDARIFTGDMQWCVICKSFYLLVVFFFWTSDSVEDLMSSALSICLSVWMIPFSQDGLNTFFRFFAWNRYYKWISRTTSVCFLCSNRYWWTYKT